jgi:SAM-dependent methyltransferase
VGKESVSDLPEDDEARREAGKHRADTLRAEYQAAGDPFGWFEACYREADGDPALVPWAHRVARPELVDWVEALPQERRRGRALDIACGLGDNAAVLARAGFDVTAFDIAETAIRWAEGRFPDLAIEWRIADLLEPPAEWEGAFDLVNETYTIQAMRPPWRERALAVLPGLVAPGGTLLIIARGRHAHEPENPPPWPLLRAELEPLKRIGLEEVAFEDFHSMRRGRPVRHFRAEYRRR